MKRKILASSCLVLSIFFLGSCFNFENKDMEQMNTIELNQYNKHLIDENNRLKNENETLIKISDGKTYNEIIDLINYVNSDIVKANVMITSQSKSFFHPSNISSGSGTIIKEDSKYYYVLTNNHVIYSFGSITSYFVYDYLNNEYSNAQIIFKDPNYDMAILKFKKGKDRLAILPLASEDIKVDENLIVVGQPKGQRNTITFGKTISYGKVDCESCNPNESNVNYDCIYYDAITTNGNSGGMILNYDFNLVGIVTFGMTDSYGKYLYGAGSPVSKIKEFLQVNEFEVGDPNV